MSEVSPKYLLTNRGKTLAANVRKAIQAVERGDTAQFLAIVEACPELVSIFTENDQKTALVIVDTLLAMSQGLENGLDFDESN